MKKPTRPEFKTKKFLNSRKFLNKTEGLAAIETYISVDYNDICGHVDISDCNRKISLDFWAIDPTKATSRLQKLDLIISELNKFKEAYLEAVKEATTRNKAYDAFRKNKEAYDKKHPKDKTAPMSLQDLLDD
jgi:hypothetical protein